MNRKKAILGVVLLILVIGSSIFISQFFKADNLKNQNLKIGAVYYTWYPNNFRKGYLRGRLNPQQKPVLGHYDSFDPKVAARHIAWCSQYGIDFLAVDFWPGQKPHTTAFDKGFLKAPNLNDIQFCIFYETWQINYDRGHGATVFNENSTKTFLNDLNAIADAYFKHPNYLKINNRPVIFLYLTRTFFGDYAKAIKTLRKQMKEKGFDPYIIADEIFWNVVASDNKHQITTSDKPQVERIKLFDALTAYNMYENGLSAHKGFGAHSKYIKDVSNKFKEYQNVINPLGIALVPNVIPGYNDRGVRRHADHYVIPRQWDRGLNQGGFLAHSLKKLGLPFMDPKLKMILITSFNEWNEDTQIEPCVKTNGKMPKRYDLWTQGFLYPGYEYATLKACLNTLYALSGRIVDTKGNALKDIKVSVLNTKGSETIAQTHTDSGGYYKISRLKMPKGKYQVKTDKTRKQTIEIKSSDQSLILNFALNPGYTQ